MMLDLLKNSIPLGEVQSEKYGFYSARAAAKYGYCTYLHEDGRVVKITSIHRNRENGLKEYRWADSVEVGYVVTLIESKTKLSAASFWLQYV